MLKKKAQQAHAKRRFNQRLGIRLHKDLKQRILRLIQTNQAEPIRRQSLRVSLFRIRIDDKDIIVVYDKKRKEIVTGWKGRAAGTLSALENVKRQ